jgi:hydroxymethylpyrimidine/phosphomethylpyrimidine kinase
MAGQRRSRRKRVTSNKKIRRGIQAPPVALTIAGSDSSAGAGIQADLKTFSALAVYGLTAVTCVVAEVPGKVSRIQPVSAAIVRDQIAVLEENFRIGAIKTGLLCSAEIISAVAKAIIEMDKSFGQHIPVVIDPVIVATSGDPLVQPAAIEAYQQELFPLATLVTPNLHEAERFLGMEIKDQQAMRRAGKELERKLGTAILLKGGHLRARHAVDLLFMSGKVVTFRAPFVPGVATHGTGCTYSAAITAGLASGLALEEAIRRAKEFVTRSIRDHFRWDNLHALNQSI